MMKTYSSWTLAVAAAVGLCALAGCNQRESANETAKDVAEERQDVRLWRAAVIEYVRRQLTAALAVMGIDVPARM